MMLFKPTLLLNRLVVNGRNKVLYDEKFHIGPNIIRGFNSTGKSTILEMIYYILGGNVTNWISEVRHVSSVFAEFEINGKKYTFKREVEYDKTSSLPVYIFEGSFEQAITDFTRWLKFNHKRSENLFSFSQEIFSLFGIPETKAKGDNNITIHQILRLLYQDQHTPVTKIFKDEAAFDRADIRQAISELILNIDDSELHNLRINIREMHAKIDFAKQEAKYYKQVLEQVDVPLDEKAINKKANELREKLKEAHSRLAELTKLRSENHRRQAAETEQKISQIEQESSKLKREIFEAFEKRNEVNFEISESESFVSTLKNRLSSLLSSRIANNSLGDVEFSLCPVCLSELGKDNIGEHVCYMCKNVGETNLENSIRYQNEIEFQVRESERLLEKRRRELVKLYAVISSKQERLVEVGNMMEEFSISPTPLDYETTNVIKSIGGLEEKLKNLQQTYSFLEIYQTKSKNILQLVDELGKLESRYKGLISLSEERETEIRNFIGKVTLELLHKDISREKSFSEAKTFEYDFGKELLIVDDQARSRFSASSMTYLKSSFLFSIFILSTVDPSVRFPRFLMLDNIEDKGMEPGRSQNFQKLIVEYCNNVEVKNQVIFTTSVIAPELENSKYCVGPFYTTENKTLKV